MEKNNQIPKLPSNFKNNTVFEIIQAYKSKICGECSAEEIKQLYRFIFVLMGTRSENIPDGMAKNVLIYFTQKRLYSVPIEELRLAFELVVAKKIEVDLRLFGDTFNSAIVSNVWEAYKKYKYGLKIEKKEIGMTNYQMADSLVSMLTPETLEHLKKIGEKDERKKIKSSDLPQINGYGLHQRWMKQWDVLVLKWAVKDTNNRFIKRYGKILDMNGFFDYKHEQYLRIKIHDKIDY